jgi:hypothetical protein
MIFLEGRRSAAEPRAYREFFADASDNQLTNGRRCRDTSDCTGHYRNCNASVGGIHVGTVSMFATTVVGIEPNANPRTIRLLAAQKRPRRAI